MAGKNISDRIDTGKKDILGRTMYNWKTQYNNTGSSDLLKELQPEDNFFLEEQSIEYDCEKLDQKLEDAIIESYDFYAKFGPRSSKKIEVIHGCIAQQIADTIPEKYTVFSKGYNDNTEKKLTADSISYSKDCDITIMDGDKPVYVISVKVPMSNYRQNSNNYLETTVGENVLMKILYPNLKTSHFIIIPKRIPYFSHQNR